MMQLTPRLTSASAKTLLFAPFPYPITALTELQAI